METANIRNIAIIAHIDHGKTTLVDQLFRQSGMFRDNQVVVERMMDSMDLERERGITISAKNGSLLFDGYFMNIIDTPGHADFGGQVERVLKMADGALLLVDAQEGPMPQTYFVLRKALARNLPIIVVLNKIDRPNARPAWALDQVFDLFVKLEAPHEILDFPVVYASAKEGYACLDPAHRGTTMRPLFETIIARIPPPAGNPNGPLQLQVSSIDYSPFLGRLGIGKITSGSLNINKDVVVANDRGKLITARITKVYGFQGLQKIEIEHADLGEIVAVAGMDSVTVGDTYTDPETPIPLPAIPIDPPTISMNFMVNNSPFAGTEGTYVTSRHLIERLQREALVDVALIVEELKGESGLKVNGRGELHLSILIEKMRREGYEFQVTRPKVILKEENGQVLEPYEEVTLDIPKLFLGTIMEKMAARKGQLLEMNQGVEDARLKFKIPTRGLIGFKSEFLSDTKGLGVLTYIFMGYDLYAGDLRNRRNGVLVSMMPCTVVAYALFNLQDRGRMFFGPGEKIYAGQIVGEHCRDNDLRVNPGKGKKLTNIRAAGRDENIILTPPTRLSLEACIAYINDDELVEVTPKSVRLRKRSE